MKSSWKIVIGLISVLGVGNILYFFVYLPMLGKSVEKPLKFILSAQECTGKVFETDPQKLEIYLNEIKGENGAQYVACRQAMQAQLTAIKTTGTGL